MAENKNLQSAKRAKKDEFYTQLDDISRELKEYEEHFKGKIVLCNCDDPYESNFLKFFALKFNDWGIKKIIATCYNGSPIASNQLELFEKGNPTPITKTAHKIEITEVTDINNDRAIDLEDVKLLIQQKGMVVQLKGSGDFRSKECIELLKQADIVVTNPPFSLFREYVEQLVKYNKKFLIIGHQNAITYKEIFPLIKDNKVWLGYGFKGGAAHFYSIYKDTASANDHREGMIRVSGVTWFTNLEHKKRNEYLDLYKKYTPEEYPKYENHDAINIDKTSDIPEDYNGVMGVPITFLDKYNPEQFEIIQCCEPCIDLDIIKKLGKIEYKSRQIRYNSKICQKTYHRLLIKRKQQ